MPHKMITQAKFGLVELGEEDWWFCSTCNMCVSRCPRGVAITDIMQSVRNITLEFDYRAAPESLRSAMGSLKGSGNPWSGEREGVERVAPRDRLPEGERRRGGARRPPPPRRSGSETVGSSWASSW